MGEITPEIVENYITRRLESRLRFRKGFSLKSLVEMSNIYIETTEEQEAKAERIIPFVQRAFEDFRKKYPSYPCKFEDFKYAFMWENIDEIRKVWQ